MFKTEKEIPDWRKKLNNFEVAMFEKYRKKKDVDREDLPEVIAVFCPGDYFDIHHIYWRFRKAGITTIKQVRKAIEEMNTLHCYLYVDITNGEQGFYVNPLCPIEDLALGEYYEFVGRYFKEIKNDKKIS